MDKKYIEILDEKNNKVRALLLLNVKMKNSNYIVYKINDDIYASKYMDINGEMLNLNNNLTEEEYRLLEEIMVTSNDK